VRARELGRNLDALWEAETTTVKDRKRLLRCLIEEVQLRSAKNRYHVLIAWKGGSTTEREVVRFAPGGHVKATPLETVALVRELAREFDDAQIARILNRQGRRSGRGLAFTKESVTSLRGKNRIPVAPKPEPRDEREGPFTLDDAARELGVTTATVQRWLKEGLLVGQQAVPGAPWRIVLSEDVRRRLGGGDAPAGWVGLSEAARRLGLGKSHAAYLVKQGKLKAVRTRVGSRYCWRIDVGSVFLSQLPRQTPRPLGAVARHRAARTRAAPASRAHHPEATPRVLPLPSTPARRDRPGRRPHGHRRDPHADRGAGPRGRHRRLFADARLTGQLEPPLRMPGIVNSLVSSEETLLAL
jgi:excisionase family DNA binding protein